MFSALMQHICAVSLGDLCHEWTRRPFQLNFWCERNTLFEREIMLHGRRFERRFQRQQSGEYAELCFILTINTCDDDDGYDWDFVSVGLGIFSANIETRHSFLRKIKRCGRARFRYVTRKAQRGIRRQNFSNDLHAHKNGITFHCYGKSMRRWQCVISISMKNASLNHTASLQLEHKSPSFRLSNCILVPSWRWFDAIKAI